MLDLMETMAENANRCDHQQQRHTYQVRTYRAGRQPVRNNALRHAAQTTIQFVR